MKLIAFLAALALLACGGAPAETPADAPGSAPTGHHRHHAHPSSAPAGQKAHWEGGQPDAHGHHHHAFDDPAKWAARWDTAERDAWQKPDAVMAAIALTPAMAVADIGAGTGYFAMRLARAVPDGVVYAIDIEQTMVDYLGQRAEKEGLSNVKPVLAAMDDARIPAPVDLVMLTNTYHHIGDRPAYFQKVEGALKPGGRVAIVDYKTQFDGPGPPPGMRLAPATVIAEMKAAGYAVVAEDTETLPRQYILIFTAAP